MSDPRALVRELEKDLLRAAATRKIVYLEGITDVVMFHALVGQTPPASVPPEGLPLDGVWIRGLQGGKGVRQLVEEAAKHPEFAGVLGFIDGDGRELADIVAADSDGPLRTWRAFCLENLLAQVCWPDDWGPEPNWTALLGDYLPYAALNRVLAELRETWLKLGLIGFQGPALDQALRTSAEIHAWLDQPDVKSAMQLDVAGMFVRERDRCEAALRRSLAEAHALVNGKWLVEVHAMAATRRSSTGRMSPQECRHHWARAVAARGGHPDVIRV